MTSVLGNALMCLLTVTLKACQAAPNIVFVMLDDLGHADLSYSSEESDPLVKTPFIDDLANNYGIKLSNYYVNPTCTPSRASLMTGRYAINSGLPFAVLPGSPIGIPKNIPLIPEKIQLAGYSTHMVGKWHLGYGSWEQTPVGRGFNSYTGFFDLTVDSWTKQMHISPFEPGGIDWVSATDDGAYYHYAEPRHATDAITQDAVEIMRNHGARTDNNAPLFLYIAFNAPHSPLLAHPRHMPSCLRIPHIWRREYCGLVAGIDEAIKNISAAILDFLGEDTVLVVSSDNGASPWEGGMNAPFRGGKYSPFEGGVKVPAFLVDYSMKKKYFGQGGRSYDGLIHISDWFPTLLTIAGVPSQNFNDKIDGFDMSGIIRSSLPSPRNSILYELFAPGEKMHDKVWGVGYRKGRYKLVEGIFEDMSYYHESSINALNYSMTENYSRKYHLVAKFGELLFRLGSYAFGNGPFDSVRGAFLIAIVHKIGIAQQGSGFTFLFDIEADPTEKLNLAQKHPDIVEELRRDLELYRLNKPHQGKYWMVLPYEAMLRSLVPGDCTMNINIMPNDCRFKHPFFEGRGIEMEQDNLVNAIHEYTSIYIKQFVWYFFQSSVHFADRLVLLSMGYILISAVCGVKIIKTIYGGFFK